MTISDVCCIFKISFHSKILIKHLCQINQAEQFEVDTLLCKGEEVN